MPRCGGRICMTQLTCALSQRSCTRGLSEQKGVPKVPDGAKAKDADGGQRHGDSAIAGALAWFATQNGAAPIEFSSGGPRMAADDYQGFM